MTDRHAYRSLVGRWDCKVRVGCLSLRIPLTGACMKAERSMQCKLYDFVSSFDVMILILGRLHEGSKHLSKNLILHQRRNILMHSNPLMINMIYAINNIPYINGLVHEEPIKDDLSSLSYEYHVFEITGLFSALVSNVVCPPPISQAIVSKALFSVLQILSPTKILQLPLCEYLHNTMTSFDGH